MTSALQLFLAGVITVLWLPVVVRFFRAWRKRKNPISLAICLVLVFLVYASVVIIWALTLTRHRDVLLFVFWVLHVLVGLNFHLAMYWADRCFPEARARKETVCG